jgi:hypothetical protein
MEALVFVEPPLDCWVLVGGVVVADDVDLIFGGYGLIDQAQKLQPLLMAMPLLAQAIDLQTVGERAEKDSNWRSCFRAFETLREALRMRQSCPLTHR